MSQTYIVCYLDKSGEQCSVQFKTLRSAQRFATKYNGMIIHNHRIVEQPIEAL